MVCGDGSKEEMQEERIDREINVCLYVDGGHQEHAS